MISFRYVPAICALLAIALVPTLIHSYGGPGKGDGLSTASIPAELAGYAGRQTDRSPTWGARRFESRDWMEREYVIGGDTVRLTVVRSEDAKSLYHHPELAIAYGTPFAGVETRTIEGRPGLTVHVLTSSQGSPAQGLYVLHYGGRFVDNPILFQARTSIELLFGRRKPMTIFFVLDENASADNDLQSSRAVRVLLAAIDSFTRS